MSQFILHVASVASILLVSHLVLHFAIFPLIRHEEE